MNSYEDKITRELAEWQSTMQRTPSFSNESIKNFQSKIQNLIPEKVHQVITKAVKELTRAVLFGAAFTTSNKITGPINLMDAEDHVKERINFYTSSATAEGAITGFGGFLSGLADFPLWLSIKMKMLFEIAHSYGFDTNDYKERIYILYVFQLAFSSQQRRIELYHFISNWEQNQNNLPEDINNFDWRTFQQEYRDHLDIAKLLQLIPGIGAVVGAYINHKLTNRLGKTAMNAYRMRLVQNTPKIED
ncbi:EcsC protein family protein [Reichenbachiella agariperforans]|uniref:EcsC protein family protein n=1 Tax=Reichenbachiella agariperforans TaxID=156994 RepID=A0A1M6VW59_REIAG|nr:EcsC family protein [Reichenbachiella agariperforans]SHK85608.1 EcsC protein family protein [Reichenbachiella agariperforans]